MHAITVSESARLLNGFVCSQPQEEFLQDIKSQFGNKCDIDKSNKPNGLINGVCVDSRLYRPNQLFFALPGSRVDGHSYLAEIAAKGASVAVVQQNYHGSDHGLTLIKVEDVLQSLQQLAKSFLSSLKAKVIAVTGSVGKTTTKDFITSLLRQKYRVASSLGNHNSQIGLPLTLLNDIQGDEEIIVLEMGMTGKGQIESLIQIAPPNIAILSSVELVHAGNFESLRDIALAKAEIFSHSMTSLGILSREIVDYDEINRIGCQKLSFSIVNKCANYFLEILETNFIIYENGKASPLFPALQIMGKHNYHNFLGAVAVCRNLGCSWEEIYLALPLLKLPERRLQSLTKKGIVFINDAYNASPVSVKAAFNAMPLPQGCGKKIAVIGEMLDLGKFSEKCHQEVAQAALLQVDSMFCLGNECLVIKKCWEEAGRTVFWYNDLSQLITALQKNACADDVILLKGSRANELWKVLEGF